MRQLCIMMIVGLGITTPAWALFGPKGDNPEEQRETIRNERTEILGDLYAEKPELEEKVSEAAGYATFSSMNINLLMVSTANGYGVVVNNDSGDETFMRMAAIGGGIGAGIKDFRALFIFNDRETLQEFLDSGWQFGVQSDAALKSGDKGAALAESVSVSADLEDGGVGTGITSGLGEVTDTDTSIEIYQITDAGIALQAVVSGTKYWKSKTLNP